MRYFQSESEVINVTPTTSYRPPLPGSGHAVGRWHHLLATVFITLFSLFALTAQASDSVSDTPLFVTPSVSPLVMLNMSNDNQLYFQAYPEYADLSGDGNIEFTYTHSFEYYGYFDPNQCYSYSTSDGRFVPEAASSDRYCDSVTGGDWSGNFLNWLSMSRIDVVRKILYGGYRSTDDQDLTVLERTYLPNDAHSWVRYYNGNDIDKLTPYTLTTAGDRVRSADDGALQFTSTTSLEVPEGSRNSSEDRLTFELEDWTTNGDIQVGDQVRIRSTPFTSANAVVMEGVVYARNTSDDEISIQVTEVTSGMVGNTLDNWQIDNYSRIGVSFCNTTASDTKESQKVTDPPLIRAARGDYSLWTANERWQCQWDEEERREGTNAMQVGGQNFSNGNYFSASELRANSDNPVGSEVGLGQENYVARVEVCNESPVNADACTEYPDGEFKPTGLLQQYGATGDIDFGLLTGTYDKNLSGGTVRKNIRTFADEVDPDSGQFLQPVDGNGDAVGSIVGSMNALRLYGYNHSSGLYENAGDDCGVGVQKSEMEDGKCMNWGNPQAEMFLETVRYFAGADATSGFEVTNDKLDGLTSESWDDPLSDANWCANLNLVNFNASYSSFDGESLGGLSDLNTSDDVDKWTNLVGQGEGLHGNNVEAFYGGNNALCTAKSLGSLADVTGLCPEAPNQDGTYQIAGLAHYAWAESIRDDLLDASANTPDIHMRTHGVALASAIPRIEIPRPGETEPAVTILPACENNDSSDGGLRCALTDFRVIDFDQANGTGTFFIQWDVHEWGSDFDMDINGTLSYEITADDITVETRTWAESSSRDTGFGYITSGTTQDGFHVHSGINGYTRSETGVTDCSSGCSVNDDPTSHTYTLSNQGPAQLLREPLYYASKWGGYDKSRDFPSDVSSWDTNGDGLPDNYYFAIEPSKLAEDLSNVFSEIIATSDSATSVATNSSRLDTDTTIFQAMFDSGDWFGDLQAYELIGEQRKWSAAEELADLTNPQRLQRNILTTYQGNANFLDQFAPNALNYSGAGDNDGLVQERINWLYGIDNPELRSRQYSDGEQLLGDIVGSDPAFVGKANFGFARLPGDEGDEYTAHRFNIQSRTDAVYVGANDGMLHGFDENTGEELMAYVPGELLRSVDGADFAPLSTLTDADYGHRYFVDGTPTVRDAYIDHDNNGDREWRTILVGTMGAGGRTVFALDVTDPEDFNADSVLWEFTHSELGLGVTEAEIVRLPSGEWVAAFGNGYDSASDQSGLFLVDLDANDPTASDSHVFVSSNTGTGAQPNAMAPPFITDFGGPSRMANLGYVGDLLGNVWRIEFSESDWTDTELVRLFETSVDQPITSKPVGQTNPENSNEYVVSFGTGSFFLNGDRNDLSVQSLYGIIDDGTEVGAGEIIEQNIIWQGPQTFTDADGEDITFENLRATSDTELGTDDRGWRLELVFDGNEEGERVVSRPSLAPGVGRNAVRFTTLIPDTDPCGVGRRGYLMELDIVSGSRPDRPVFDFDGDGQFDESDMVEVDGELIPVSGVGGVTQGEELSTVEDSEGVESIVQPIDPDSDDDDPSPGLLGDGASSGRLGWEQVR